MAVDNKLTKASSFKMNMVTNQKPFLKKKKVRFCVCRFTYVEPPPYDDKLNRSDLYYTPEEYREFDAESIATIRLTLLGMSTTDDKDGFCLRGLERCTMHGSCTRWYHDEALNAVLREQAQQKANGIFDPESLSQVYQKHTTLIEREAHKVGLQDAFDANKAYLEDCLSILGGFCFRNNQKSSRGVHATPSNACKHFFDREQFQSVPLIGIL